MIAQLRDMLAAEDSPVVAQQHQHRGSFLPQCTEANLLAVGIRELKGARVALRVSVLMGWMIPRAVTKIRAPKWATGAARRDASPAKRY